MYSFTVSPFESVWVTIPKQDNYLSSCLHSKVYWGRATSIHFATRTKMRAFKISCFHINVHDIGDRKMPYKMLKVHPIFPNIADAFNVPSFNLESKNAGLVDDKNGLY